MEPMITERTKHMMTLFLINFTISMTVFSIAWFLGYKVGKENGAFLEKQKHIRNFRWPEM
jgi:hypothetical protein